MGFNWDELLKGLGQPRKDAPKEIVPEQPAPAAAPSTLVTGPPTSPPIRPPVIEIPGPIPLATHRATRCAVSEKPFPPETEGVTRARLPFSSE